MKVIDAYREMLAYLDANPKHADGCLARCGKSRLIVTPQRDAYVLGDGYANWTRPATLTEIESLPETVGDQQGECGQPPFYRTIGENFREELSGRHNHPCSLECLYAAVGKSDQYR